MCQLNQLSSFMVALAYIISPIDLIPDYIIGLGQIDDVAILGLSLYFLGKGAAKIQGMERQAWIKNCWGPLLF
jgi:uncharacterized membrane protein YkvA (DUF1232 family)